MFESFFKKEKWFLIRGLIVIAPCFLFIQFILNPHLNSFSEVKNKIAEIEKLPMDSLWINEQMNLSKSNIEKISGFLEEKKGNLTPLDNQISDSIRINMEKKGLEVRSMSEEGHSTKHLQVVQNNFNLSGNFEKLDAFFNDLHEKWPGAYVKEFKIRPQKSGLMVQQLHIHYYGELNR